ncbi:MULTISPECIES: sulfotransferase family 2 domain-containing protein [Pseudoalteromonas]|uniref:sulfotransferase family 2 domain-containing protein n=1 Tax=Pseudoalteromonas TaxID=53246 RepID=UPI001022ACF7|nr:sulfotransferase family 2 domain-containing protein [Pseudoalteromonas sp. CO342X]RZG14208.1 hypothetical protein EXT47_14350 [Pseudoalteromonas sp. CO342X]
MIEKLTRLLKRWLPLPVYPYKSYMVRKQCIFIHIPKNAGTSVLKAFGYRGYRLHAKWFDYNESNPYLFERYHKFAIVRAPLARLYSAYNYVIKGGNQSEGDRALQQQVLSNARTFTEFVDKILTPEFVLFQPLFQPQSYYIFDSQYQCKVDTILRYESLNHDWRKLCILKGWKMELPWLNKGASTLPETLSPQQLEKIQCLYKVDYELLGYRFNE